MTKSDYVKLRSELNFVPQTGVVLVGLLKDADLIAVIFLLLSVNYSSWLFQIAADLGAAAFLSTLYFRGFSLMHDAVHGSSLKNKNWNDALGIYGGILCFLPFEHWREIHLLHHQWAGNVEKDPVMRLILEFRKPAKPSRRVINFLWKMWFPVLAVMQEHLFWILCVGRFRQKKEERTMKRFLSLALPLLFWGTFVATASWQTTLFVFIPSIVMYLLLVEVINFPHHMSLPKYEGDVKLPLWDQYKISRTCVYNKWFESLVLLNFNYHTEHHLFPTLPWYRLRQVSEILRQPGILPGYNMSTGHEWIVVNRKVPLDIVTQATHFETLKKAV